MTELKEFDFNYTYMVQTILVIFNYLVKLVISKSQIEVRAQVINIRLGGYVRKYGCYKGKAGFTRQDGEGDCVETIEELNKLGIKAIGYCYYHSQDLARTVDPSVRNLLLGFDSPTQNDKEALQIAKKIIAKLRKNGFQVEWTGTVNQRIEVKNINWQKTPDNEEWDPERVINILTK